MIDLRIEQIVYDGKDFGKDNGRLGYVRIQYAYFVLVARVAHESGQHGQDERLSRVVDEYLRVEEHVEQLVVGRARASSVRVGVLGAAASGVLTWAG